MFDTFMMPVKPYTSKYLELHFGKDYKITQLDHFGIYLIGLLRRPLCKKRYDEFLTAYTAKYSMKFNLREFQKNGKINFSSQIIITYNNFVELIIKTEFHAFVEANLVPGTTLIRVIESFRNKYSWTDEDISLDTLIKSFQRYRKKREKNHNLSNSLGSLSSSYYPANQQSAAA